MPGTKWLLKGFQKVKASKHLTKQIHKYGHFQYNESKITCISCYPVPSMTNRLRAYIVVDNHNCYMRSRTLPFIMLTPHSADKKRYTYLLLPCLWSSFQCTYSQLVFMQLYSCVFQLIWLLASKPPPADMGAYTELHVYQILKVLLLLLLYFFASAFK